ncbi:class I SAM-dependent methyltransferase [Thermasporomyces composti]|uniref:Methyltransferase family protein n=1 Tax=Thermasporomyces composti TaxID=696763 RepID=A0A3D9VAB1_THECX|nr:class I SAM-dependent methyltransferase [Thermasporomyces composti]REF35945.1 methyltransferase family protein [Thermasporomyces composti]
MSGQVSVDQPAPRHAARTWPCPVCGERRGDEPAFAGWVRACVSCGFMWTVGAETVASQADLYDEDYFLWQSYHDYFGSARQRRWEATRRLRWLLKATHPVRPRSLVEAGAAAGFFVAAARGEGIDAVAIEPARVCVRYARDRLGIPVHEGTLETVRLERQVEAVCAFHVLEHTDDVHRFLSAAHDALLPGGWLALEVPNAASPVARRQGRNWPHLSPLHHRWHFGPQTLVRLVESHGFVVIAHDTLFGRHYMRRPWLRAGLVLAESRACHAPRLRTTHPRDGDLLRLIARRPEGTTP